MPAASTIFDFAWSKRSGGEMSNENKIELLHFYLNFTEK